MRAILLAALFILMGTASAFAQTPAQNLSDSLPIARAAWPTSQCLGRESVTITSDMPADVDGYSLQDGSCTVHMLPFQDPYRFCTVLTHEFGHLAETRHDDGTITLPDGTVTDAGGHTANGSVMDSGAGTYAPCQRLVLPLVARSAAASFVGLPVRACRFIGFHAHPFLRVYHCGAHARLGVRVGRRDEPNYVVRLNAPR